MPDDILPESVALVMNCDDCGLPLTARFSQELEERVREHVLVCGPEHEAGMAMTYDRALAIIFREHGIPDLSTFRAQFVVFMEAMSIYAERHGRYGDGWKRYGWLDSLLHVRNKFMRTETEFWRIPPETNEEAHARLDNPFDMLNYLAFFIRNVRDDNERGRE